jgi:hypothetical protein
MEQKATVSCELVDAQGRVVQTIFSKKMITADNQQLSISWKNDLPLGNYLLKMTIGNKVNTLPLVKVN